MTDQEIVQLVKQAKDAKLLPFSKISRCVKFLQQFGASELVPEMTATGLGSAYVEMEMKKINISPADFITW